MLSIIIISMPGSCSVLFCEGGRGLAASGVSSASLSAISVGRCGLCSLIFGSCVDTGVSESS